MINRQSNYTFNRLVQKHVNNKIIITKTKSQNQKKSHINKKSNNVKFKLSKSKMDNNYEDINESLKNILLNIDHAFDKAQTFESPSAKVSNNDGNSPPTMHLNEKDDDDRRSPAIDYQTFINSGNDNSSDIAFKELVLSKISNFETDYNRLKHECDSLRHRVATLENDREYLIDVVAELRKDFNKTNEISMKMYDDYEYQTKPGKRKISTKEKMQILAKEIQDIKKIVVDEENRKRNVDVNISNDKSRREPSPVIDVYKERLQLARLEYSRLKKESIKNEYMMIDENNNMVDELDNKNGEIVQNKNNSNTNSKPKIVSYRDSVTMAREVALPDNHNNKNTTDDAPKKLHSHNNNNNINNNNNKKNKYDIVQRTKSSLIRERERLLAELTNMEKKQTTLSGNNPNDDESLIEEVDDIINTNIEDKDIDFNDASQQSLINKKGGQKIQLRNFTTTPIATDVKKVYIVGKGRSRRATFGAIAEEAGML